jgi:hypothetical protein
MSGGARIVRWRHGAWSGRLDVTAGVAPGVVLATATAGGRRSRHAVSRRLAGGEAVWWIKRYVAPQGHRAWRAWRMGVALRTAGFHAPCGILVGSDGREGILLTRDVGLPAVVEQVSALQRAGTPRGKWRFLRRLGHEVGRLHEAGFVHGDLVPSNLRSDGDRFAWLDHDRTRRSGLLVWWQGWRNLVQLGRFVIPGVALTDRARVLAGYAEARGLSRRARHRLAARVVAKTRARRTAIDGIPREAAAAAGFGTLMRAGGPFDPVRSGEDAAG